MLSIALSILCVLYMLCCVCSKGDYDSAIAQYIRTIGKLEPSYVIRKVSSCSCCDTAYAFFNGGPLFNVYHVHVYMYMCMYLAVFGCSKNP
jgi:hypothetical protein